MNGGFVLRLTGVVYAVDDVKLRVSVTRIRHRSEVCEG